MFKSNRSLGRRAKTALVLAASATVLGGALAVTGQASADVPSPTVNNAVNICNTRGHSGYSATNVKNVTVRKTSDAWLLILAQPGNGSTSYCGIFWHANGSAGQVNSWGKLRATEFDVIVTKGSNRNWAPNSPDLGLSKYDEGPTWVTAKTGSSVEFSGHISPDTDAKHMQQSAHVTIAVK